MVITPPSDPTTAAAIELLKLVSDPVATEKKLRLIADEQAGADAAKAAALAATAEMNAREQAAGTAIAEAGKAVEYQRRVEADNKRRSDELDAREKALVATHRLFETSKAEAEGRINGLSRQFEEREHKTNAHMREREAKLAEREEAIKRQEANVAQAEKSLSEREADYNRRMARLKELTS